MEQKEGESSRDELRALDSRKAPRASDSSGNAVCCVLNTAMHWREACRAEGDDSGRPRRRGKAVLIAEKTSSCVNVCKRTYFGSLKRLLRYSSLLRRSLLAPSSASWNVKVQSHRSPHFS